MDTSSAPAESWRMLMPRRYLKHFLESGPYACVAWSQHHLETIRIRQLRRFDDTVDTATLFEHLRSRIEKLGLNFMLR